MNISEKEKKIIQSAMKLISSKGFSSTSIQEIAIESGISKGAFYLHFKSKEELLTAIFHYNFDSIINNVKFFEGTSLPPREKFIKQLTAFCESFLGHREFMVMLAREQAIPLNTNIKEMIYTKIFQMYSFLKDGLLAIYGPDIKPYSWDLTIMLEGMTKGFIKTMLFEDKNIEVKQLIAYMMNRLDSLVAGMQGEQPFISEEKAADIFHKATEYFSQNGQSDKTLIQQMKSMAKELEDSEDVLISLEVLEAEILSDKPRLPVIQGMLYNIKEVDALKEHSKLLINMYQLKL
ncbi:TetR family transcriptional regulator [Bacillus lacus]|uniref:TetR family transcriptional regulator n=1 Tax=Metabacillus lacus TaxID=1983721 RepID=A0A7X2LZ15_9BACI|nr:TetR/AcrR family transcriptional regulator [Metabacillus lacus]MRX72398.1 TetR family transcriptional regulator [Metabacillus lacus]